MRRTTRERLALVNHQLPRPRTRLYTHAARPSLCQAVPPRPVQRPPSPHPRPTLDLAPHPDSPLFTRTGTTSRAVRCAAFHLDYPASAARRARQVHHRVGHLPLPSLTACTHAGTRAPQQPDRARVPRHLQHGHGPPHRVPRGEARGARRPRPRRRVLGAPPPRLSLGPAEIAR